MKKKEKDEKISFFYRNKKLSFSVRKVGTFGRIVGLMFKPKKTARALLFNFEKEVRTGIHSFFVFFVFLAVWLDANGKVVEKKIIKPFTFYVSPKKPFKQLVEIPVNRHYEAKITSLVGD